MDRYNRDELQPPSWMDEKFLETVLKTGESCKDLKIIDFDISPATEKGDHFASVMFRVIVEFIKSGKPENVALIIKTMPSEDGKKKDLLKESSVFETEIGMYAEVIPKFHSVLRQCGDHTILGARMLYSSLQPHKIIVLEDITTQGYTMIDNRPATFAELNVILEKICRWHAIGFKLISEGDASLDKFNKGLLNTPSNVFIEIIETSIIHFTDRLSTLPEGQIYYEKFNKIKDSLIDNVNNIYRKSGSFCVVNHGDFHINNVMTKFGKTGQLNEVMLIDFQFSVLAPIAIDLLYLLYMILDRESRDRRDEVIYIYHTKFVDVLKNIGFSGKIPSLPELHMEIMRCRHLELLIVASMFPFACGMSTLKDMDPEELVESADARKIFYGLPVYTEELKSLLPMLLHKGYLDE